MEKEQQMAVLCGSAYCRGDVVWPPIDSNQGVEASAGRLRLTTGMLVVFKV